MKYLLFVSTLLLTAARGQAQSTSAPPGRASRQLTVRLTLPTAVGAVGEFMGLLKSSEKSRPQQPNTPRTSNPVVVITMPLPRWLDKKTNAGR
ncbi:hypothetical protein [Hymenobacter weizhouensis]|uniref:hypothetical protein n=1 Tax=Hymenobacter sp. YIM 151500-1 TaxID=2987689 RepID=UPI002226327E|nr:hypothetical protein [Hymenobacter sp. YIM 151500-1]UYZ63811.1 hypothetical protein OIS53_02970 [Hymenobacter sp. YIM 151500-1]